MWGYKNIVKITQFSSYLYLLVLAPIEDSCLNYYFEGGDFFFIVDTITNVPISHNFTHLHPALAPHFSGHHHTVVCVQKVSSHVLWKIETLIEEDTWYKKHYRCYSSVPFKEGTLRPHIVLPIAISCPRIFLNLINSLKSLPFQRWF